MGATLVHVCLFYREQLKPFVRALNPWNKTVSIVHDEHYLVMQRFVQTFLVLWCGWLTEFLIRYEKVPRWWFVALLVAAYSMAQVRKSTKKQATFTDYSNHQATDYTGNSHFTWWQLTVVCAISFVAMLLCWRHLIYRFWLSPWYLCATIPCYFSSDAVNSPLSPH